MDLVILIELPEFIPAAIARVYRDFSSQAGFAALTGVTR